jgi:tRNA A-37 threonylcarbamoyl transferase component Bud32
VPRRPACVVRRGALKLWYRLDAPLPLTAPAVLDCLEASDRPPAEARVLKHERRRSIFEVELGGVPVVVKAFPLARVREKWRWPKYAPAEMANYLRARSRGMLTPAYYGLFRIRRRGLVDHCGVVMESLRNHTPLERLAVGDESQWFRAIAPLAEMHAAGVHHLDVTPSNLFFDHTTSGRAVVIDWQYCWFHARAGELQLVMQAAHFLSYADITPRSALWNEWVLRLSRQTRSALSRRELENAIHNAQNRKTRVGKRLKLDEQLFRAA